MPGEELVNEWWKNEEAKSRADEQGLMSLCFE